ncbi:hypothetical protein [Thermococcus gorgonarius]|uniref:DUF4760 domain-containing protein n=1 Tax=Thermococcus gorgonarius TaxID=71997 RepID=A0A2Z2MG82_THEGO|nr:hypothetical protein [Thermococcus gorgonarius]ASJ00958.1 hypothetical protein A3K92_05415 [Thermococcus gorgonarius]
MNRIKVLAIVSAFLIIISTGIVWLITADINITLAVLTLASTIATVMMAVTIYELDIAIKELNFETVSKTYEMMDEKLKKQLGEIKSWKLKKLSVEEFLRDSEKTKTVREASKTLNRIGYFVYREFIGDWFIQEQYAGLVLDSFLAMKEYLKALRDSAECEKDGLGNNEKEACKKGPWFMRRFYLLLVVISYAYLCERFPQQCEALFRGYGLEPDNPVPSEWLEKDVKKWLKRKGYGKYL